MFYSKSEGKKSGRSARLLRLVAFMGPALIVSVAYQDPGNFASDIESGALTGYTLLWVVWLAGLMAMVLQYLSGKLGIATGKSLPELIRSSLGKPYLVLPYWLGAEAASAAVDLAEFLGTVIALHLIFGMAYLEASLIGVFDVFLLIYLQRWGFRRVEQAFFLFVGMIGIGYVYELLIIKPDIGTVVTNSVVPSLNAQLAVFAVSIIGATVMPHVLFLHSDLTRKKLKTGTLEEKRELLRYHRIDTIVFLTAASIVNACILIMAAAAFHARNLTFATTIDVAYHTLRPLFGNAAAYVFVATLLASGLSSSTTGTIAGQSIMEGMLGRKVNPWLRRIVTRVINVFPTTVAILIGLNPFFVLFYSQVVLSIMIPLPMIPLIYYSSRKKFMGDFVNRKLITVIAVVFASVILGFNIFYLLTT